MRSANGGRVQRSEPIAHRSAIRSSRPDDASVRARLRELAAIRRRFGYRRLDILLMREGIAMNHKKLRRLYREERLQCAGVAGSYGGIWVMTFDEGGVSRWV